MIVVACELPPRGIRQHERVLGERGPLGERAALLYGYGAYGACTEPVWVAIKGPLRGH